MIGQSFQEAFTYNSSIWSPHKNGEILRKHSWLLMDEKKSYLTYIGLPLASNDYKNENNI
jgi:hypothetical protein